MSDLPSGRWKVQYRTAGDPRWVDHETGDERLCRVAANRVWAVPWVTEVRLIEVIFRVHGVKNRSPTQEN